MIFFGSSGTALRSLSASLLLLAAQSASAATTTNGIKSFVIPQNFLSVRALGMGNAFTAVADDYNTLFYNPAGLARLTESQVNMGINAMEDPKALQLKSDIDSISNESDETTKDNDMVNLIAKNNGNHYSARAGLSGFWVKPNWGFALIPADVRVEAELHQIGVESVNIIATQDTTLAYGRGWDLHWGKSMRSSMGFTGKAVYRAAYVNSLLAPDIASNPNFFKTSDAQEGLTFDGDVGFLFSPVNAAATGWGRLFHPTLGLAAHNIVDYGFTSNMHLYNSNTSGEPAKLGRRFDAGLKWELPRFWIFGARAMADLHDMATENWTFTKGYHLGAEFDWKIRSWWQGAWRVGVNQGYFAAGVTGKLAIFNLDLATYAEEVGPSNGVKANRRYVARLSLDW